MKYPQLLRTACSVRNLRHITPSRLRHGCCVHRGFSNSLRFPSKHHETRSHTSIPLDGPRVGYGAGTPQRHAPDPDQVDPRAWPIAASSLITGSAIGVVLPVMPLFAKSLGVSATELGLVVGVMGLARLLFNVPAAVVAQRYGRRPLLVGGSMMTSVGMGFTALSTTLMELMACRFMVGVGGSFQITGAQLYLTDISSKANRARTIGTNVIAFNAGTLLGPAIGGYLAQQFGLHAPFYFVAAAIACASLNNSRLTETRDPACVRERATLYDEISHIAGQWRPLLASPDMRTVMVVHGGYWMVTSGALFTMMPLLAVSHFGLGPSAIGLCFATQSAITVVGAHVAGWISDKYGRKLTIVGATVLIGCAASLMPFVTSYEAFMALIVMWGMGNTLIGGGPAAYVADISSRSQRPQALAILRSAGDLGLMMGASVLGTVSDVASLEAVFGCAAAMILSSGAYFAFNAEESVGRRRALPGAKPMGTRALGPDAEEPQATSEKWGNGAAHRNANKTLRSKNWAEIP
uniref:Major facilitator superfamily (MFS) profile domain-containing protein n=1 Tax=Eutreptiella gymnastica TaxID=73025 RepID=A0A7S4LNJ0_9EUGL